MFALPPKNKIKTSTVDENGLYHSFNDEPAIVYIDGMREWWKHGKLHRENGPAMKSYFNEYFYLNGTLVDKDVYELKMKFLKMLEED